MSYVDRCWSGMFWAEMPPVKWSTHGEIGDLAS